MNEALRLLRELRTDPGIVAPLFFPLEHEAAVFLPLWAPLLLPVLVGTAKEVKRRRGKRKRERERERERKRKEEKLE